ncbi:ssDNA-binding protein, partial [Klebsiella pneumoniae]|uniref:ssDNA-binding protein n=1 Tax=Klebsiella pneumoniae TaxID=573 RepID=UPI003A8C66D6
KYTVTVLIPKKDKKTVEQVKSAIAAAMEKGKKEVWSGKNHKKANNPLRDGDDEDTEKYPYYKDCYFIQAKSTVKPSVMD